MKAFFVMGPDGTLAAVAACDESGGSASELQHLQSLLAPKFGLLDATSGWTVLSKHFQASPDPVLLMTQERPVVKDRHYQIAKFNNGASAFDYARIRHRKWLGDRWSDFDWFGPDIHMVPWSERERLANDPDYQARIAAFTKPEPSWPQQDHGYITFSDDQVDWYHVGCSVHQFFNGRRDILVSFLKGETTELRSDDGDTLYAIHDDTIQSERKPREYTRWLNSLYCPYCNEKIV